MLFVAYRSAKLPDCQFEASIRSLFHERSHRNVILRPKLLRSAGTFIGHAAVSRYFYDHFLLVVDLQSAHAS